MIVGIDHVQVAITSGGEAKARDFYGRVLGLAEIEKPRALGARGGVWFACGSQQLHCGVEDPVAPSRRHPALLTDDIDAARETLAAAGFPVIPDDLVPGVARFYTEDPFGNRLEIMQRQRVGQPAQPTGNPEKGTG